MQDDDGGEHPVHAPHRRPGHQQTGLHPFILIAFHRIALHCIATHRGQGMDEGAFATVLTTFALSSVVVGGFFFLLGKLKVGPSRMLHADLESARELRA